MPRRTGINIYRARTMIILDEHGNRIDVGNWEWQERGVAVELIEPDDCVLELGARYGACSCAINDLLNVKTDQVVVEPDQRVWAALEYNRSINQCAFQILKGYVSKEKLSLKPHPTHGEASQSILDPKSKEKVYSLEDAQVMVSKPFTALIADCEGCLERFLDHYPDLLLQLRFILFESDYPDDCDYPKIKHRLRELNFNPHREGFVEAWVK